MCFKVKQFTLMALFWSRLGTEKHEKDCGCHWSEMIWRKLYCICYAYANETICLQQIGKLLTISAWNMPNNWSMLLNRWFLEKITSRWDWIWFVYAKYQRQIASFFKKSLGFPQCHKSSISQNNNYNNIKIIINKYCVLLHTSCVWR